jgi:5-methyltetrahydrofolate--homocysteine methyltransferase
MIYALRTKQVALIDGGSDLLLVETILTRWMLKRHFCYRRSKRRAQYWYSNHGVRNDYGCVRKNTFRSNCRGFLISISHIPLLSVGFNCALGADQLKPYLKELAHNTSFNISAHPNAGLPNAFEYDETPEQMVY